MKATQHKKNNRRTPSPKKKTETLKTKVLNVLQENIMYADDDQRLVARIIWDSMPKKDITAKELLKDMFINKKYPKPKSIDINSATKKYTIVNMPTKIPISCHPNLFIYEYIVASC